MIMAFESKKRRTLTLTLTHNCNLYCTYCYEKHDTAFMTYEQAIEIIEKEFTKEVEEGEIELDFFGGEPFLEFETIQKVVDYVESNKWPIPYCFFATTNGTLVHGKIQKWLKKHPNFYCGLSFDGTPDMQDKNRSNSSRLVDLDFFKEQYPTQDIKMTISKETLNTLYEGVAFLENKGFLVSCNLAYGIDWSDESNATALERELLNLIDCYLDNPQLEPCRILKSNIDKLATYNDKTYKYCGTGTSMVAYDVDGKDYPCQLFMPISCGKEKASKVIEITFYKHELPDNLIENKCKNCVVKNVCPTCFGANYIEFGDIYHHSDSYCKLTKIIMKARSYFRAKQWELGQVKLTENEELIMLKSIAMIQEQLV